MKQLWNSANIILIYEYKSRYNILLLLIFTGTHIIGYMLLDIIYYPSIFTVTDIIYILYLYLLLLSIDANPLIILSGIKNMIPNIRIETQI
jgi:hypothetical protein